MTRRPINPCSASASVYALVAPIHVRAFVSARVVGSFANIGTWRIRNRCDK
jgi:hypothetical protein